MIHRLPAFFRLLPAMLVLASHPAESLAAEQELAGTTWQLQAIQSMSDTQGTTKVAEPQRFTLAFGRDGHIAMRLDCNRGMANYNQKPATDGTSGTITFGPLAATRAMCPPPHLDERVVRDLPHVRSYLLKEGKLYLALMADAGIYEWAPVQVVATAQDPDRVVKPVRFAKGKSRSVIRDRIQGRQYVDYQLRAGAGQRMTVRLTGGNGANYFNVLPPGSSDGAMAIGEFSGNRFDGLLPDDGLYTVRVFLVRAAARRNERSDFTLSIGITGSPLKPVPVTVDAAIAGTRYHARATTTCEPAYTAARECEALVVRRGFDGTATVELRWESENHRKVVRSILFVKGEPKVASVPQAMSVVRSERGWRISFGGNEHFDIPESLVYGG